MPDQANSRWMPTSPHREAILEALRRGRAHLEERGHNRSPLLVFEDGGAMELALARLVDGKLVAVADAALPEANTRHVDVCGTIDELKRLLEGPTAEGPNGVSSPQASRAPSGPASGMEVALLDHALSMLERMHERLGAYRGFQERLAALAAEMAALQPPDHAPAPALAEELRRHMAAEEPPAGERLQEMFALAEAIREIAGNTEQVLYRYRDLAIEVGRLYDEIRGAREWEKPRTEE